MSKAYDMREVDRERTAQVLAGHRAEAATHDRTACTVHRYLGETESGRAWICTNDQMAAAAWALTFRAAHRPLVLDRQTGIAS